MLAVWLMESVYGSRLLHRFFGQGNLGGNGVVTENVSGERDKIRPGTSIQVLWIGGNEVAAARHGLHGSSRHSDCRARLGRGTG